MSILLLGSLCTMVTTLWLSKNVSVEKEFLEAYHALADSKRDTPEALQKLYEEFFEKMSTTSLLSSIEKDQFCHEEGHELGKVIYRRTGKNLSDSFYTCGRTCADGCYHGVFMEAFRPGEIRPEGFEHVTADEIRPKILEICTLSLSYQAPEECAHAVGHGLMLNLNEIAKALDLCTVFTDMGVQYYCSTGVFMQHDIDFGLETTKNDGIYAPCDTFPDRYGVACYRYKVGRIFALYPDIKDVVAICTSLSGKARLGCFHGLGVAQYSTVLNTPAMLKTICSYGTSDSEILACIDGAMENVTLSDRERGKEACDSLSSMSNEHYQEFCLSINGKENSLERETLPLFIPV